MEAEIVRFICANHGAVNTEELLCNVGCGDSTDIISNRDKFVLCCLGGQPKVLARTRLTLCRVKDCPGTCRQLHLCKNILFRDSCTFSGNRRGCIFCHDMNSFYNTVILREHGLESLSRSELCTLLLQSDKTLLPSICHDYNNAGGEFGGCENGGDCRRLHVCERYLNDDCSCFRSHDFNDSQPLKRLQANGIPDTLMSSLKTVYVNKAAIWQSDKKAEYGNKNASNESDLKQRGGHRGRGRGGFRGNRGSRGHRGNRGRVLRGGGGANREQMKRASSTSAIFTEEDGWDLYTEDGLGGGNSQQEEPDSAGSDAASDSGQDRKRRQNRNKTAGAAGGRGEKQQNSGNCMANSRSMEDLISFSDDTNNNGANRRPRAVREKTEICLFFIKGHCKHDNDKCFKVHDKMPYRWEMKDDQWKALPDNEGIEKDYCDPKNTYSGSPMVHFDTMTCGQNEVRRLSTSNCVVEPTFMYTTEWLWYWEDEQGRWKAYAADSGGHGPASVDSNQLEQKFLINDKDVVEFTAVSQSYSLSFPDMMQTNKKYGTKRLVRRRPLFVSAQDVLTRRVRKPQGQPNFCTLPNNWDKSEIPATGHKRIPLSHTSDEFTEIQGLFFKTMKGFDIVSIERIQNKALWEVFQWQKNQLKTKNGGRFVAERKLFHGTDSKYVDAICLTNFDWRICGTHGTAFGKGSYFARDARYSHNYTCSSGVRSMFVSRVLVGDFTRGSPEYVRPPSKDGGDVNFYDSCVDDVRNPSIFVVFEKHQIYPEYLLQYRTQSSLSFDDDDTTVTVTNSVARPRPTFTPSPSFQASAAIHNAYSAAHLSSTASYTPSTTSYQPSTLHLGSSYQPQPTRVTQRVPPSPPPPSSLYRSTPPTAKKNSDSCVIA